MAVPLTTLVEEADRYLGSAKIADYCPNGLQVEGRPQVMRIVSGVTASQALLDAAVEAQAPATVARRQKSPSQKAMPIIGEIFQKISSPFTTPGNQKANSTPPATTTNDVTRPTNK